MNRPFSCLEELANETGRTRFKIKINSIRQLICDNCIVFKDFLRASCVFEENKFLIGFDDTDIPLQIFLPKIGNGKSIYILYNGQKKKQN